ncbi:MAG: 50S ribosomal protein L21e [Candidatus Micrarchaeota archaeon]|nr:50S ribosomal protein L21e [Candidatus Micrarchaeota archaeon]
MKRSAGIYSKHSRRLYSRGRITVAKLLKQFPEGSCVRIRINPCFRGGAPLRFNNRAGKVIGKRGNAFEVRIMDGGKEKTFYVKNVHLVAT